MKEVLEEGACVAPDAALTSEIPRRTFHEEPDGGYVTTAWGIEVL